MTSNELSVIQGNLNRTNGTLLSVPKESGSGKGMKPEADCHAEAVVLTNHQNNINRLQAINDTLNTVASNIRVTATALDTIEKKIVQMHEKLKAHIKNFPPFLPGSEERVKFLKSFNTFRKQIDSMTFPPEHDYAMKIMADPSVVPGAGDWEIILGENGPHKTIHSKEVHTGPTGLNIPELRENADDKTIETAIAGMNNARFTLKQLKGELSRDISEIAQFKNQLTRMDDLSASAAEPKSMEVRHSLANLQGINLTEEPSNLIYLLDN